jgi:hypothetical protein
VLEACGLLGIRRAVLGSSESSYGICFANEFFEPQYLPIDEDHPQLPEDSYGLSKVVGEVTAEMFHRRDGTQILSYRIGNVLCPEDHEPVQARPPGPPAERRFHPRPGPVERSRKTAGRSELRPLRGRRGLEVCGAWFRSCPSWPGFVFRAVDVGSPNAGQSNTAQPCQPTRGEEGSGAAEPRTALPRPRKKGQLDPGSPESSPPSNAETFASSARSL